MPGRLTGTNYTLTLCRQVSNEKRTNEEVEKMSRYNLANRLMSEFGLSESDLGIFASFMPVYYEHLVCKIDEVRSMLKVQDFSCILLL